MKNELTAALATIEKFREISGCPAGIGLQDHLRKLVAERDASLNAERIWEKTMMEVCGEDGPESVANEIRALQGLRDTALTALMAQVEHLAAENVAMKGVLTGNAYISFIQANGWNASASTVNGKFVNFADPEVDFGSMVFAHAKKLISDIKTHATDAYLAGIKADGVEELLAALENHETFWSMREIELGSLSPEAAMVRDVGLRAIEKAKQLREGAK